MRAGARQLGRRVAARERAGRREPSRRSATTTTTPGCLRSPAAKKFSFFLDSGVHTLRSVRAGARALSFGRSRRAERTTGRSRARRGEASGRAVRRDSREQRARACGAGGRSGGSQRMPKHSSDSLASRTDSSIFLLTRSTSEYFGCCVENFCKLKF